MTPNDSRRGASNLGVPLMIGTFVLLGGFLYWLSATAEPTAPPIMEGDTAEVDQGPVANLVEIGALAGNSAQYVGQMVRAENTAVAQQLGEATFFVNARLPFLVRMSPDLVAAGETVPTGFVTVVGRVRELNDSIRSDWIASGAAMEAQRVSLDFASHYMLAEAIFEGQDPATGGPGGEMDSGDNPSGDGN